MAVELEFIDGVLQFAPEQLVIELLVVGKCPAIDRIDAPQEFAGLLLPPFDCLGTLVGPAVVIAAVAQSRCKGRVFGQVPFPVLVQQGGEILARSCQRGNCGEQQGDDGQAGQFHQDSRF